eukprot:gene10859-12673_t
MHSYTLFPGDRGADGRLLGKCVCGLWEDKATPLSKCPNARDPASASFSPPMMVPVPVDLVAKIKKMEIREKNKEDFAHAVVTTEAEWISHLQEQDLFIEDHGLLDMAQYALRFGPKDTSKILVKTTKVVDETLWDEIAPMRAEHNLNEADVYVNEPKTTASAKSATKEERIKIEGTQSKFTSILAMLKRRCALTWTSRCMDRHTSPSFGKRKPDIPSYVNEAGSAGPNAITMFGDIKPTLDNDDREFTNSQ